jgi:O-antigen/teichoic acid export membrane protein
VSRRPAGGGATLGSLRLASNVGWNFLGLALPLAGALVALPYLVGRLGTDRLGVLSLAWLLIGYLNLFDLGVGRAVVKLIADRFGVAPEEELADLVWTALTLTASCGVAGGLVLATLTPWLVRHALEIPPGLEAETIQTFLTLSVFFPVVMATTVARGVLEALQRFRAISVVRGSLGLFTFLGPAAALVASNSLVVVTAVLGFGRLVAWVAYFLLARSELPSLGRARRPRRGAAAALLRMGGWMMPTNLLTPVMAYLDRFVIGSTLSIAAVTFYVVPYEAASKLLLLPAAVAGVLFPTFAMTLRDDHERAHRLFVTALRGLLVLLGPATLIVVALADEGLGLWLGPEFAQRSTVVLQWLAVGILCNSLAHIPFAFLQGAGRPDLTFKLTLCELPVYAISLVWVVGRWGLLGAAALWALRAVVDLALLLLLVRRLLGGRPVLGRHGPAGVLALAGGLLAGAVPAGAWATGLFLAVTLPVFLVGGWTVILDETERLWIRRRLGGLALPDRPAGG